MPSNASRAALAAELRYQPQSLSLLELLRQAQGRYTTGTAASAAAAKGVGEAARAAIVPTRQDFQGSREATLQRTRAARGNIAELGAAATPYKASFTGEAALADQLSRQMQRETVSELRSRGVDAAAGAVQEQRQLRAEYAGDVGDIGRQLQQVASQQGAYTSSVYQDLVDAAANRDLRRLGLTLDGARLDETRRHNQTTEGIARQRADQAGRRRGGRRGSWLAQSQQNAQLDDVARAVSYIRQLDNGQRGSGRIRQALLNGVKVDAAPVYDDQGRRVLNKDGTQKTTAGVTIPAFDRDLVNAAYDLHELGYLSRANIDALHRRGSRSGAATR